MHNHVCVTDTIINASAHYYLYCLWWGYTVSPCDNCVIKAITNTVHDSLTGLLIIYRLVSYIWTNVFINIVFFKNGMPSGIKRQL